ncbi:hypothetical protein F7P75_07335 [Acinetobacter gandensis]|uniref:Uncharacterized protein n=2 Tax=Moraxellaceae TaxID=468 RepID=A0A1A7RA68_9GAMM|nr:hypothetical protein F7P75_07335 [Acinetobacter gandensis]OBX28816.1 hypothetical protein A9J31_04180 [Acinetobacter gandensis]
MRGISMQSAQMLAVLFIASLVTNPVYAQGFSSTILIFSSGMMVLAILTIYVVLKIRNSLRHHLDKPAK